MKNLNPGREPLWGLVPPLLARMAAWSACLILVGVVANYLIGVVAAMRLIALPVAVALLLTALLFPLTKRLGEAGMRPIYATWVTMLVALAVLAGTGWIIGVRGNKEFPGLVKQVQETARTVEGWLYSGPLRLEPNQLSQWVEDVAGLIRAQQQQITTTVLQGTMVVLEVLASIVLLLFVTFFLLKDGDRIWAWFLKGFGTAAPRVDRAGRTAWATLSHYVHGTVAVAAVHGIVIGIVLAVMGVPLWPALALLIFLASFVPIVGIFFAGAVATLVTLGSRGPVYALIFIGILVVEQQLENHVLQPLIVGRVLRFHPLAIILVLAVGGILAGIAGAVVAVPIAAILYRSIPELFRDPPPELPPPKPGTPGGNEPPRLKPAGPGDGEPPAGGNVKVD
ncbi:MULTISPECIES: AI-2E family transporter [unclassified Nonomuraea]|uniref:AI-2E family transporter n=1 Tax=unclassified Nonomuraea TaxID=2593643 RepID=UPI00207BC009|nr:AI-2E family transporter [Nonomuraea sp. KC401]